MTIHIALEGSLKIFTGKSFHHKVMEFAFTRKFFVEGWLPIDTIQQHNFMMCNKFLFAFISYDFYVTVIDFFTDNDSFYNYVPHFSSERSD